MNDKPIEHAGTATNARGAPGATSVGAVNGAKGENSGRSAGSSPALLDQPIAAQQAPGSASTGSSTDDLSPAAAATTCPNCSSKSKGVFLRNCGFASNSHEWHFTPADSAPVALTQKEQQIMRKALLRSSAPAAYRRASEPSQEGSGPAAGGGDPPFSALSAVLYRELLDSQLVTIPQWNDSIAPAMMKLGLAIEKLERQRDAAIRQRDELLLKPVPTSIVITALQQANFELRERAEAAEQKLARYQRLECEAGETLGDRLDMFEAKEAAEREAEALKHDLDTYLKITADLTSEAEALRKGADRLKKLCALAQKKTAYDIYGNGCLWTIGIHSDNSNKAFLQAIDEAMKK